MSPSSVTADPETMALRRSQRGVRDSQKLFSIRKECIILGGGWGCGNIQQEMMLEVFSNQSGMKIIRPLLIRYSFISFIRQKHFLIDNLGGKRQTHRKRRRGEGKTTSVLNDLFWSFVRSVALLLLLLFSTEAKCECHL